MTSANAAAFVGESKVHPVGVRVYVDEQVGKLQSAGLEEDVSIAANLSRDAKIQFYRGLTLLSVPALYGESFGLYAVEALACGVPLVQPDHAAFHELVQSTGGGVLVPPEDDAAYDHALLNLVLDSGKNQALGAAGRAAVLERYSVENMAEGVLAVLHS